MLLIPVSLIFHYKIKILVFLARSINKSCKLTETEATVRPRLSVSPLSEPSLIPTNKIINNNMY